MLCGLGSPGACHPPCEDPSADLETTVALAALRRAAAIGDAKQMVLLARLVPQYVVVNVKRMAIQLKACKGDAIVASLTVKDAHALVTLATALGKGKWLNDGVGSSSPTDPSK